MTYLKTMVRLFQSSRLNIRLPITEATSKFKAKYKATYN